MLKRKAKLRVDGKTLVASPGYKRPPESPKKKAQQGGAAAAKDLLKRTDHEPTIDIVDDHKARRAKPVRKTKAKTKAARSRA